MRQFLVSTEMLVTAKSPLDAANRMRDVGAPCIYDVMDYETGRQWQVDVISDDVTVTVEGEEPERKSMSQVLREIAEARGETVQDIRLAVVEPGEWRGMPTVTPTPQQLRDAEQQINACVEGNATDCIVAMLTDEQVCQLAEDYNEGREETES